MNISSSTALRIILGFTSIAIFYLAFLGKNVLMYVIGATLILFAILFPKIGHLVEEKTSKRKRHKVYYTVSAFLTALMILSIFKFGLSILSLSGLIIFGQIALRHHFELKKVEPDELVNASDAAGKSENNLHD